MRAADFAQHVHDAVQHGDEWMARCPAHDDRTPSLTFCDADSFILVRCHAGCSFEQIMTAVGLTARDLRFDTMAHNGSGPTRHIVATFDYQDETGSPAFQVVRFEPKEFRQRRPDGHGGWIWNLQGVVRLLYRLPMVLTDYSQPICFHEGEKACDAAVAAGLPGVHTTTSGGASNGHLTDVSSCGGRDVLIVPDHDDPGRRYAETLATRLVEIGATTVRIVPLPNLPQHGDVVEWLATGGTPEQFVTLCQAAGRYDNTTNAHPPEPTPTAPAPSDNRPELDCDIGDLDESTRQAWGVIQTGNAPPQLFLYGSVPSRIELDEDGRSLRIIELTADRLRYHAAQQARWTKTKKRQRVECRPPMDVIKNLLAAPEIPLPILSRIVEVPVFSDRGTLVQRPGYDAEARLYYQPYSAKMTTVSISAEPTADEVATAKARLDDLIRDFPFVSDADTAHAVALALVPFVRDLIDGPTPLHMAEAACPGSGKTLLIEAVLYPSVGTRIGAIAEARDDDEWRKRLTARLREGCPVTLIDNLSRPLDSGTVSAVLTARRWEDRLLGKTETIAVPVRSIFVCTANNPVLSMEIARRSIRIRLDPKMDRPWLRNGFRHPDLRGFIEQERPALIAALLTLVQAWMKAGRPKPAAPALGSFESWSNIVGGIVEFAGYKDFLGNALEFYEAADSEGAIWRLFVSSWWDTYQGRTVSVKELFDIATEIDGFHLGRGSSERGQRTVLGHSLKKHRDQIVSCFRITEAGTYGNGMQWRLQSVVVPSPEPVEAITLT
jgi:hypothetical protein